MLEESVLISSWTWTWSLLATNCFHCNHLQSASNSTASMVLDLDGRQMTLTGFTCPYGCAVFLWASCCCAGKMLEADQCHRPSNRDSLCNTVCSRSTRTNMWHLQSDFWLTILYAILDLERTSAAFLLKLNVFVLIYGWLKQLQVWLKILWGCVPMGSQTAVVRVKGRWYI